MKNRPVIYAEHQYASTSEPIYVVSIEFSPASFEYFASHAGIPDIPAGVIEGCIEDFSAVSQSFNPETGVSRIGSLTILLGDIGEAVTDALQARLAAGTGPRDKQLRLYKGFAGLSFNDYELKWTQVIHEIQEDHARYTIRCSDLQRAMRTEIFQLKTTVLDATLSAAETGSMTVTDTTEFVMIEHGSSYAHGPSQTWGYVKVDDEVIGYQGKTAGTLTGLDRGLFNTLPAEHVVDPADAPERRPEVEEYVYLQMPVPKLIKALMTGVLHGQAGTLPAHWHEGIDAALIDDSQFTGIGPDLWDPANDSVGLPVLFSDVGPINGKRFIESEIFLLAQIFSPVLADGRLGLKRFTPALARAAHLVTLNEQNVVKHSALKHSMREVFNRVVLNWSWIAGEFRRQTIKLDTDSIAKHGQAPIKVYNFRGLHSSIATKSVLDGRFDAIRDRFSAPPLGLTTVVSKSLDRMEIGDVALVQLKNVRDSSAGSVNPLDRAFEIRQIRENRKQLQFVLSGSAAEAVPEPPAVDALPDAFYDQEGTELSTVVTIIAGVTQAGTFTLVGNPLLSLSVFYFVGNLTISANTILQIDDNVQLRVRGFVTLNGDIDGVGRGLAGVADGINIGNAPQGQQGFFGSAIGGDGVTHNLSPAQYRSRPPSGPVSGALSSAFLNLSVDGNTLRGLPTDLRGCSGGPGGKLIDSLFDQVGTGGTGGDGGSGLMVLCRGMSFGGGATIDLSGSPGASAVQTVLNGDAFFPGGGGGGAPGAFYLLLDGNRLVPDVSAVFSAISGNTPVDGTPLPAFSVPVSQVIALPATGFRDRTRIIDSADWSGGAFRAQFVPVPETPVEDLRDTGLTVYYILATSGNAIHNGVGNLTLEAHRVTAGTDELLSTGTIQLFDPLDQEVTAANGYVAGSDGYTGILDSGDITGDIVVTLKDGALGTPLDSITLVDIADGATGDIGADGIAAVLGFIEPENGLAWTRAVNAGAWTPAQLTTDLDCTFVQGGVVVARVARRITLTSGSGTMAATSVAHKGGDLNTARVNVTITGNGTTAITVQFDYSFGGDTASVAETALSSQSGDDGATGSTGPIGATGSTGSTGAAGTNGAEGSSALNSGRRADNLLLWFRTDNQSNFLTSPWTVQSIAGPIWPNVIQVIDNSNDTQFVFSERMAIVANQKYRVAIEARQPSGDRRNYLLVAFYDSAGVIISSSSTPVSDAVNWSIGTYHYWEIVNSVFTPLFTRYEREFGGDAASTIPSNAVTISIGGLFTRDGAVGTNTTVEWQDLHITEVAAGGGFTDIKFQRATSQPATPIGDNPAGWTDGIPLGSNTLWQIAGPKNAAGVLQGVWSTPSKVQGLVFRGAYSAATAYIPDDIVTFQERTYINTLASTGNDPTGSNSGNAWWDLLAGKGDTGAAPTAFNQTIVISGSGPVNLRALADAHIPAYDGIADATVTFTIANGVTITGNANGGHGLVTGSWPAGAAIALTLENDGIIRGGGGRGGAGGDSGGNGSNAINGGDAISVEVDFIVNNAPGGGSGLIQASGGAGGGGNGGSQDGGGGGGGGFPNGSGGAGGAGDIILLGNNGNPGAAGTASGGGTGGLSGGDGTNGGNGGAVNTNGTSSGGLGSVRGFAVRRNGHTVTVTGGTVTGQQG